MPVPVTPDVETWRAMTLAEREAFIISVNEALSDPVIRIRKTVSLLLQSVQHDLDAAEHKAEQAQQNAAQTLRKTILKVLAYRNVTCSPGNLARIESCTDIEALDQWLDRAFEATTESDVFGNDG